ncbi:serine/threonine-protein kinase [Actinorugispora endophytica]|uniref:Serine/threonine protein kinase n=1 Tax=Actinorugispora endophytica TaxID=1605990 RepID=A0A4R6UNH8_9ACTN|nr:serine/threonine-protein kinase [Actinorugispora endophytica]TDQ48491.1 serine/threonine protein kinase [Actinorugispora endophytica]
MTVSAEFATVPYPVWNSPGSEGEPPPGEIGGYRVVERIGAGGAAVVHTAIDAAGDLVAVKTPHPELAEDPVHRARFAREAVLLGRVDDAYVAALVDADVGAPRPWLAMRYLPGPTLGELVDADGPMAGAVLLEFTAGLAEALVAIHRAGIVHRDLKPDNVILSPDGPRVLDFGIARAVEEPVTAGLGEILGSPGWISPEQFRERVPQPSADVFAWGGMTAYASTGRRPFGSGTVRDTAMRVLNGLADLRGTPHMLLPLVEAALATDPERRPAAAELAEAVGGLVPSRPARGRAGPSLRWSRRS